MNKQTISYFTGGAMLVVALLVMGQGCVPQDAVMTTQNLPPEEESSTVGTSMKNWEFQGQLPAERIENKQATIKTDKGDIVIEFFPDEAPVTVSNFIYLAEGGYYDGLTFHRVEKRPVPFVIQGGDPEGNGTGGPGYKFADEPVKRSYTKGIVAMANAGPDTNGSQFFIMLSDYALPPLYTIFGQVISGQEVVDQIAVGDVMNQVVIEEKKQ